MKLKTSGQELVKIVKFEFFIGIIFFLIYFFPPTAGLKIRNNMVLVFRVNVP